MARNYLNLSICDMQIGDSVEGFFLLSEANVKTSGTGSSYLAGKLKDAGGTIDFKIWDYASDIHEHAGEIVKIRGSVSEYRGTLQLKIDQIRPVREDDVYDLSLIVPCAPIDPEGEAAFVLDSLKEIRDETYRAIALKVYERMGEALKKLPAAKSMHHAFVGGWLMHTSDMMQLAFAVANIYGTVLDEDLLLCGVFCHDIGKRREFLLSQSGLVSDYSVAGNLLGHSVMGAQEVADAARELGYAPDSEKVMLLQHMLLSHHGVPEWGAAVVPCTIEAEVLSLLDRLDARIEAYCEALDKTPVGEMSDYIRSFEHAVYRHR